MPLKSFISWLRGENADVTATDALANPTSPTPSSPPQANLSYQRLEPKLVLNASFALDAFGFLSLDDFVDSTPADNDLTISQSASTFSFVLNDGVWNGTDATGLTGNGTDTLAINLSDVSLNSISIDSNTTDQFDIEFGALSFAGDLNIESTGATAFGSITQTDSIKIGGTASFLSATEIVMTHAANDFLGTVNAASDNIQLTDQNDLQLGAITATGDLTVTSTDVEVTAIGTVNGLARFVNSSTDTMNLGADVGGEFSLTNAELSNITATDGFQFISNNENVVVDGINQATDVEIIAGTGNVNFDGAASSISSMTVSSSTAIGQSAEINVTGIASFTADNNIILNDLDNDFQDTVNADGGNVDLADANNIELGNVNTTTLNVAALNTGAITQNNSGINVASTASFTAADDDVTLNTASNDFQGTVNTNGANVDLTDANDIELGDIDAATLDVTALSTGDITQDNSGITVTGDASFTATDDDITLNTTSNDFQGNVNADGANVDL
ncbi:MAG: hypothetical protein P8J27_15865, partial [Mariniblastus sp.]|nr:hypothetical protein [Mariniblastus sp.]